ncbi:hypothetical protein C2E23DRAFT_827921 [Lenzites betulinus]|nr:hypothetical protein C2E23DRAFT_827921 [Lenzites betulinus]
MGMHPVDRSVGSRSLGWPSARQSDAVHLCALLGPNRLAEYGRAVGQSRFNFLKLRRRNSTASVAPTECDGTEPPTSECGTPLPAGQDDISDQPEEGSLKRRRSVTPEAPAPEATCLPRSEPLPKRRRTSEPEERTEQAAKIEEIAPQSIDSPPPAGTEAAVGAEDEQGIQVDACETAPEPKPSSDVSLPRLSAPERSLSTASHSVYSAPAHGNIVPIRGPSSPSLPEDVPIVKASPLGAPPAPAWPRTPAAIMAVKPSAAFQAFSGTTSAFASFSAGPSTRGPAWSAPAGDALPALAATASDPLAALSYSTTPQTNVTGEEDEEVVTALRGAKVFIKRGERDFCEGILGNVKLLKHKKTGHERILFRREPVMKVSMNVPLRPLVRCSFDEAQGQLRVALMEPAEDAAQQDRVAVYALKRGKASRTEFADFAQAIMESARVLREEQQLQAGAVAVGACQ